MFWIFDHCTAVVISETAQAVVDDTEQPTTFTFNVSDAMTNSNFTDCRYQLSYRINLTTFSNDSTAWFLGNS